MSSNTAHTVAAAAEKMLKLPGWLWPNSNVLSPLYKGIWEAVQEKHPSRPNVEVLVDTNKIFPLLLTSQLPTEVLGYIWSLANQKYAGQLTEQELYIVLALVALAQASYPFNSLEVLTYIRTPPTPNLNLALLGNDEIKTELNNSLTLLPVESSKASCNSSSIVSRKHTHLGKPTTTTTTKLDGLQSRNHSHLSDLKEIKSLSNDIADITQPTAAAASCMESSWHNVNAQLTDIKSQVISSYTVDNDEYSDFQSAPVQSNVPMIPNLWDSRQGSAIGSRLANHNLGIKKSYDKMKKTSANKNNSSTTGEIRGLLTSVNPVTMHNRENQFNEQLSELFPKCLQKSQSNTIILKDTIIRHSNSVEVIKPITKDLHNTEKTVVNKVGLTMPGLAHAKTVESAKNSKDVQQDLMNLQPTEDKYSALRALDDKPSVINPLEPTESSSTFPVLDDFGEFISAEQFISASPNHGQISVDLLSEFDFNTNSTIGTNRKSSPSLVQEISDAFDALVCEVVPVDQQTIEKSTNNFNRDSGECNPLASEILTRSGSVLSLNLKSFTPSVQEDEQHIENMHQIIYWEWKQYMESCLLLLQVTTNVFNNITSEIILKEVLSSAQGYNFLCNLAEVAAVCRRVNFSHKEIDINIMGFDDLLMDIDRIWSEMEPFYTDIPIITELPSWPLCPKDGITCALCLTLISNEQIIWNNNSYHASCANLWLHTVNNNLPVLRCPIPYMSSATSQSTNH
ncbi:synergin gamma-like isoform X2 [Copidosoma floridanum]|uniref:synergin gamma-like isoform X2 n=1 Tax=Copidosoma floridanum TaxID=29053 RepID=UPI0006C990EF|nr:synergin gamma-like isoform X2 [Copidosoma floridanum]